VGFGTVDVVRLGLEWVVELAWFLDRWFSLCFMVGREFAVGSKSIVLCLRKWEKSCARLDDDGARKVRQRARTGGFNGQSLAARIGEDWSGTYTPRILGTNGFGETTGLEF